MEEPIGLKRVKKQTERGICILCVMLFSLLESAIYREERLSLSVNANGQADQGIGCSLNPIADQLVMFIVNKYSCIYERTE